MPHPEIDLISGPSLDCLNPVYNCIEFCLLSNDYLATPGVAATWSITWSSPLNYADGIGLTIAGVNFMTGTPTTFEVFQWFDVPALTIAQIADNCFQMLQANFAFLQDWQLTRSAGVGTEILSAVARDEKAFSPFTFSFDPGITVPPVVASANGAAPDYLENYQIVVQVWTCEQSGSLTKLTTLLSTNSYVPDAGTLQVCFDLQKNLSSLVETTWPGLVENTDVPIKDLTICKEVCLRYGQIFDDGASGCDVSPQYFEISDPFQIVNAAFQKPEEVDSINSGDALMKEFCHEGVPTKRTRFLTDYPDSLTVCPDTCFWIWYNHDIDLTPYTNLSVFARYQIFYTDGSSDPEFDASTDIDTNGCWIIPAGDCQLKNQADPLKTISRVFTRIFLTADGPLEFALTEGFNLYIDNTDCCCRQFYFLNEKGGFDVISFNCEQNVDLSIESVEVCGFEKCQGDILKGGKAEADRRALETFTVFGRWNRDYLDLNWFRQFLKSPIRYVVENGRVLKIKLLTDEVQLFNFEEKIFVELQYTYSFELNQQNQ